MFVYFQKLKLHTLVCSSFEKPKNKGLHKPATLVVGGLCFFDVNRTEKLLILNQSTYITPTKMVIYSHSRLSTFEQCPLKFKFRYIDKLPPDIKETIESFLGSKVHGTLEWVYKQISQNIKISLDDIIEHFIKNWNRDFNQDIKIIKQEFNSDYYFNQGIRFLINYFQTNHPFDDNTIAIEKRVLIKLDSEGKYLLQGYIDRLVYNKEKNILEIHDYKTGGFLKTQEELDNDRQLALYSIGIRDLFQDAKEVHLIWHFLAFNEKRISKRTFEQLVELKQETINLINKIESEKEFQPKTSPLCKWCEFRSYCPTLTLDTVTSPLRE